MEPPALLDFGFPVSPAVCMSLLRQDCIVCTSNELCVEAAGLRRSSPGLWPRALPVTTLPGWDAVLHLSAHRFLRF